MARAMSMLFSWAVFKARQISRTLKKKLIILTCMPYDITLSMLAYIFLSKVSTLTQSNSLIAILSYVHFSLILFAGIAVLPHL